jgi:hypothetical protein
MFIIELVTKLNTKSEWIHQVLFQTILFYCICAKLLPHYKFRFFLQSFSPLGCWYISMTKPVCQLHFLTGSQPFTKHPFHTPFHPKNIFVSDSCFISIQIFSQWKQGHVQLHITRLRLRKNKDICQPIYLWTEHVFRHPDGQSRGSPSWALRNGQGPVPAENKDTDNNYAKVALTTDLHYVSWYL